jgi:hypothetical protein
MGNEYGWRIAHPTDACAHDVNKEHFREYGCDLAGHDLLRIAGWRVSLIHDWTFADFLSADAFSLLNSRALHSLRVKRSACWCTNNESKSVLQSIRQMWPRIERAFAHAWAARGGRTYPPVFPSQYLVRFRRVFPPPSRAAPKLQSHRKYRSQSA